MNKTHKNIKYNKKTSKNKSKLLLNKNKKQLFFIHIPKTAGTTIENILYDSYKNNYTISIKNIGTKNINKKIKTIYKNIDISIHHIPPSFFKQHILNEITKNYIVFAVVRNPYDRIISDFKFWIKYLNDRKDKSDAVLTKKEKSLIKQIKTIYKTFTISSTNLNNFVHSVIPQLMKTLSTNNLDVSKMSILDGHLIPMHYYTHINKKQINDCEILQYENLNIDFNKFINKYKLNIPLNTIINDKYMINTTKKTNLNTSSFDKKSLNLIQTFYDLDFKYFNYDK